MATVGSLNAKLSLNSTGFTTGLSRAQASTSTFLTGIKSSANGLFTLGGGLELAGKGFNLLKGIAGGFGFAIAGEVVPAMIKGVRTLFGWNEQAEIAAEKTRDFIGQLRQQQEEIGKTAGEMAALKAARLGASEADQALAASLARDLEMDKGRFKEIDAAEASIAKLREEIETFGMSSDAVENYRIQKSRATQEQKKRIAALYEEKSALERTAEAEKNAADKAIEAAKRREEADKKRADMLDGIRLKVAEFNQSLREANLRPQGPSFGSAAALRRIDEINSGTGGRSLLEKLTQDELAELRRHGDLLRAINRALESGNDEIDIDEVNF